MVIAGASAAMMIAICLQVSIVVSFVPWEIVWDSGGIDAEPVSGRLGKAGLRLEFDHRSAEMYPFG
jgi:hypothetical protein